MPSCFSALTPEPFVGAFFFQGWSVWTLEDDILPLFPRTSKLALTEIVIQEEWIIREVS